MRFPSSPGEQTGSTMGDIAAAASRHLSARGHRDTIGPARRPPPLGTYLERLVGNVRRFADTVWDTIPMCWTDRPPLELFDSGDLDALLQYGALRLPEVRLVAKRENVPAEDFSSDLLLGNKVAVGVIDTDRVRRHIDGGGTLVLQGVRRYAKNLDAFSAGLESDLGVPVQASVFVTGPNGEGIPAHHDLHGVFVVQIEGSRRWQYGELPPRRPRKHLPPGSFHYASMKNEVTLNPGDCLYLPRGVPHVAHCVDGAPSLHVTLSFRGAPTTAELTAALVVGLAEVHGGQDKTAPIAVATDDAELGRNATQSLRSTLLLLESLTTAETGALLRRIASTVLGDVDEAVNPVPSDPA